MITLIEQTLDIIQEMALTGDKEKDAKRLAAYAIEIVKGRLDSEYEQIIAQDPTSLVDYVLGVLDGDFSKIEDIENNQIWNPGVLLKPYLKRIILYASSPWNMKAYKVLLATPWVIAHDLGVLMHNGLSPIAKEAWNDFVRLKFNTNKGLVNLLLDLNLSPYFAARAWDMLKSQNPTLTQLYAISRFGVKSVKDEAYDLFLDELHESYPNSNEEELGQILRHFYYTVSPSCF